MSDFWLERAFVRRAAAELELQVKGYSAGVVEAGIERAWGAAWRRVEAVREPIRLQAFYDTFLAELAEVEAWCHQVNTALREA
jgi:hypothetical protein